MFNYIKREKITYCSCTGIDFIKKFLHIFMYKARSVFKNIILFMKPPCFLGMYIKIRLEIVADGVMGSKYVEGV